MIEARVVEANSNFSRELGLEWKMQGGRVREGTTDVGNIGINVPVPQPYAFFPLGSKNESALGVAKSRIDSMRLFLDQKTVTERR